jgi:type I restriction enzyme S subunit
MTGQGSVGRVGRLRIKDDQQAFMNQRVGKFICDENGINIDYLYFVLTSDKYQDLLFNTGAGSGQPNLSPEMILDIEIPAPEYQDQLAIAEVLSSLDDKIDLLHRQNKTLESLAQTLFRQWFIEEADESWNVGSIRDLVDVLSGFAFKSSEFSEDGEYRLVTIKSVQDGYLDLSRTDSLNSIPARMPNYCFLRSGDILLSLTGNVGRCCLVNEDGLLLNQRVAKLSPKNKRDRAFTYAMFRQSRMKNTLEELAKGTAQLNLSPIEMADMSLSLPPESLLETFAESVNPVLDKLLKNKDQIKTLGLMRDSLLPKLMSGEVTAEI